MSCVTTFHSYYIEYPQVYIEEDTHIHRPEDTSQVNRSRIILEQVNRLIILGMVLVMAIVSMSTNTQISNDTRNYPRNAKA